MYYIVYIMKGANIGNELLTASIQYIINVALTFPAILYLDKFGRRPALLFGFGFLMIFLFISGALQAAYGQPDNSSAELSWVLKGHPTVSRGVVACSYLFVGMSPSGT